MDREHVDIGMFPLIPTVVVIILAEGGGGYLLV